ncbi:hypothetical protein Tco_1514463 [Tanacetum coccineum]
MDSHDKRWMLLDYTNCSPLLENISIIDTNKRGIIFFIGGKITEVLETVQYDFISLVVHVKLHKHRTDNGSIEMECIQNIPLLETVSVMDCDKRWRVSASGVKVTEMRNDQTSASEESYMRLEFGCRVSRCYVPLLELPVSGYVMKGVTLFLFERDDLPESEYDSFWKTVDADFEDKEEAAYCEAMMEIFKNHTGRIERLNHLTTGVDF